MDPSDLVPISQLRNSLVDLLSSAEIDDLIDSLLHGSPTSLRFNRRKSSTKQPHGSRPVHWAKGAYYLNERPPFGTDLDFHLGRYYVQEASSMFLEHALSQLDHKPRSILDLCAAPGGKSTILIDSYPQAFHVCNEVDGRRRNVLIENLSKWGYAGVFVSGSQATEFGSLSECFDLILVDAPCSGEGMLRKSSAARQQYGDKLVADCQALQHRILEGVLPALRQGGILAYCTCTWNTCENEHHFKSRDYLSGMALDMPASWKIHHRQGARGHFYRLLPHRIHGEGLTLSMWQKTDNTPSWEARKSQRRDSLTPTKSAKNLSFPAGQIWTNGKTYYVARAEDTTSIHSLLYRIRGHPLICLGKFDRRDQLIPDITLAQQMTFPLPYESVQVDPEMAHQYIRRQKLPALGPSGTWQCLTVDNLPLGWIKNVDRRANNYYPKQRAV